jgi:hypothetical protein
MFNLQKVNQNKKKITKMALVDSFSRLKIYPGILENINISLGNDKNCQSESESVQCYNFKVLLRLGIGGE